MLSLEPKHIKCLFGRFCTFVRTYLYLIPTSICHFHKINMYIFDKHITPRTIKGTFSTFPSHPSLEKPWIFNYSYRIISSNFHFPGDFVFPRPISRKRPKHETMIWPIKAYSFKSPSKTGNAGNRIGFKATLQQASINKISLFSSNHFSVADLEYSLNHMSKWLVMTLLGAVLVCRHDNEALWVACGSVVNAAISTILKKILNQDRPVSTLRSDPGMPSSHAQTIFFTVIFAIISMFQYRGTNVFTISLSGITLAIGSYLSWLRVTQEFHTISQVVVGAVLGTIISMLWIWSWDSAVHEAFISISWVRIIVNIGAVVFWIGFLMYLHRNLVSPRRPKPVETNTWQKM